MAAAETATTPVDFPIVAGVTRRECHPFQDAKELAEDVRIARLTVVDAIHEPVADLLGALAGPFEVMFVHTAAPLVLAARPRYRFVQATGPSSFSVRSMT